jgi:hypothetical protein
MATDQESIWLRCAWALLRHVKEARVEIVLREFTADAEARLELLDEQTTKSMNRTPAPSALTTIKLRHTEDVIGQTGEHDGRSFTLGPLRSLAFRQCRRGGTLKSH